jgi:hypothetical protein
MPARKKLPPVIPPTRKKAQVVKFVPRWAAGTDFAWGPYCLWPRRTAERITLPVIRIERY